MAAQAQASMSGGMESFTQCDFCASVFASHDDFEEHFWELHMAEMTVVAAPVASKKLRKDAFRGGQQQQQQQQHIKIQQIKKQEESDEEYFPPDVETVVKEEVNKKDDDEYGDYSQDQQQQQQHDEQQQHPAAAKKARRPDCTPSADNVEPSVPLEYDPNDDSDDDDDEDYQVRSRFGHLCKMKHFLYQSM